MTTVDMPTIEMTTITNLDLEASADDSTPSLPKCDDTLNTTEFSENQMKEWLKTVLDPELYISVVDLGLVYGAKLTHEGKALVDLTLTSPGCPAGDHIVAEMKKRLLEHPLVKEAEIQIVWEPKWDPKEMATEEGKEALGIW
jgi:metal-sulfur cluster biosynthetic enzyme